MIKDSAKAVVRGNVGRLAERIVANEFEWRGFRVSDLNKDGLSPNVDLIAADQARVWQIQVKGATNTGPWWIQYGHCTPEVIDRHEPMFNRRDSFYKAEIIALVAVRSPSEYRCVILSADDAERAAQINLDRDYRTPTREGAKKKPHKVWAYLQPSPREGTKPSRERLLLENEREILLRGDSDDAWKILR